MLHKLLLVEGVEVAGERFCHNRVHDWLGGTWAAVQLEGLIGLLVGCLKFELLWLVVRYSTFAAY